MRTSGFDNIVRDLCGPQGPRSAQTAATPARSKELDKGEAATESEDDRTTQVAPVQRAVLYVGQSAGAICGSASVDVAHFKGWCVGQINERRGSVYISTARVRSGGNLALAER
jgi:hypothetical protein